MRCEMNRDETKQLNEWEAKLLSMLNMAFLRAKAEMDKYIAYLRAEHDAPVPEWLLRNVEVGFERRPRPEKKEE